MLRSLVVVGLASVSGFIVFAFVAKKIIRLYRRTTSTGQAQATMRQRRGKEAGSFDTAQATPWCQSSQEKTRICRYWVVYLSTDSYFC